MEEVVLVTADDQVVGHMEKLQAHTEGRLHRAVSVCLFDRNGRWLLQRRAMGKYHSPGKWSNSCCGHPKREETPAEAASRRLFEELGVRCPLTFIKTFVYKADVENGLVEHEVDHLFTGRYDGPVVPTVGEVSEVAWWEAEAIFSAIQNTPTLFTAWFPFIFNQVPSESNSEIPKSTTRPGHLKV